MASYKRQVKNTVRLYGVLKNRKVIFQMLLDAAKGNYRMRLFTTIALVLSLLYILFPFDLIPDFIPIAGWLDDGAVIYFLAQRLLREAERYSVIFRRI